MVHLVHSSIIAYSRANYFISLLLYECRLLYKPTCSWIIKNVSQGLSRVYFQQYFKSSLLRKTFLKLDLSLKENDTIKPKAPFLVSPTFDTDCIRKISLATSAFAFALLLLLHAVSFSSRALKLSLAWS